MRIDWCKSPDNAGKLFIDGKVYTIKEACKSRPDLIGEILGFVKATDYDKYKELLKLPGMDKVEAKPIDDDTTVTYATANAAAKWWADKLRGGTVQNNGESMQSLMMTLFAMSVRKSDKYYAEVDKFEKELINIINESLKSSNYAYLSVDYDAEGLLLDAIFNIDIDTKFLFPVKTSMRVTKEDIQVSEGYQAPYKQIYPKLEQEKKK